MAIAFDAKSDGAFAAGTTHTLSHTVTGTNVGLVVFTRLNDSNADDVTGVTYNAVAMTQRIKFHETGGNTAWVYGYTLAAPSTGANNIVVSTGSSRTSSVFGLSYTGCDQTTLYDNSVSGDVTGATVTLTLTPNADNCWLTGHSRGYAAVGGTAGTNTTLRSANNVDGGCSGDNNAAITPAASTSIAFNHTSGYCAALAISIKPFVATVATVGNLLMMGV